MSHREGDKVILQVLTAAKCSDCGAVEELRPYGKEGVWVCFTCMMKDEKEGVKQFTKLLDGERDI